jgi:hypothetical protein
MGQIFSRRGTRGPHGCARPLDELERLWPNGVLAMGIEDQAELADDVCLARASSPDFCRDVLADLRSRFPHEPPTNTTGVGNLAYLALHAPEEDVRVEFITVWTAYTLLLKRMHRYDSA